MGPYLSTSSLYGGDGLLGPMVSHGCGSGGDG